MSSSWEKELRTLLDAHGPRSVLVIGRGTGSALADYEAAHPDCCVTRLGEGDIFSRLEGLGRYDLGLIFNTLEHMDKTAGARLIARLRDLHTGRFYAAVPAAGRRRVMSGAGPPPDLIAYGMVPAFDAEMDGEPVHVYQFDIADYKKTPDWLNPSHWANPELWDKYRW